MNVFCQKAAIVAVMLSIFSGVSAMTTSPESESVESEKLVPEIKFVTRWVNKQKIKVDSTQNLDFLDERVIVGNDTVPIVIPQRNYGRYDRGLYNFLFIPKGKWAMGLTASYGEFSTDNYELLEFVTDIDFKIKGYSINPEVYYFFKSNQAVGLRFNYTRMEGAIDSFKADIDEDINFNLAGIDYKNTTYSMSAFYRNYLGLSRSGRFAIFNEVAMVLGGGDSYFTRNYNSVPKVTRTNIFQCEFDFSPGVCVFIQENVSFNVSFGVFGIKMRRERQWTDNVEDGSRFTSGANFRFNLFNINFGMGIHI